MTIALGGSQFGGVEEVLLTIAKHRQLTPSVEYYFALFDGTLAGIMGSLNVPVSVFERVRLRDRGAVRRIRRQLAELLSAQSFDAVVIHQSVWLWIIFARVVKRTSIPLIFWQYDNRIGERWLELWARVVKPDFAICISAFAQAGLPRLFPRTKSAVVYSPVDLQKMRGNRELRLRLREALGAPADTCVIIQTGRFARHKGHLTLFHALEAISPLNWVCWQVGAPQLPEEFSYFDEMKQTARVLGIADRIHFTGRREDLADIYAASDLYCQPNTSPEGYGLTFIEALNNRLPVVTSAIGGAKEIVDDTCGLLIAPGDAPALAEALGRLVSDSALRSTLAEQGPRRADLLSNCARQMNQIAETIKLAIGK
ncbi:MAG TPA: glycosyltransferase family 4 protein [Candidatus Binataceae bacterium]|nr:glycosyltransferase family 4 protein [Candidatus Binataceae bacterium]